MDPNKGKPQHSYKGYKSAFPHNFHHESSNYNLPSNHGIFNASIIQRHSLKWRKDHLTRGNYRSKFPYRKHDMNCRKSSKSAEDMEEEERKKKLTDTANKLLSKIKTWNAEKNQNEDESQQNCNINQPVSENLKHSEEKTNSEGKPKRIAHSKKTKLVKNRTSKSFSQPVNSVTRYEVNKDTVKDFQNRIQHKLIEEIMQMPKENLQNVLNDPKINPRMEVKMSRLVRENKLLIAQKLRALAESKMKSPGSSTNPQLLVDIDKLIDPVIETDLSVLPFELIKQMENVFQVQFDYSLNGDSQVESTICDSATDIITVENGFATDISSGTDENVKVENNEDLSFYECSTDEDEEIDSIRSSQGCSSAVLEEISNELQETVKFPEKPTADWKNKKRKHSVEAIESSDSVSVNKMETPPPQENENVPQNENSVECLPQENTQDSRSSAKESTSVSCQTDENCENASTQTTVECLYGVPLPKEATDESISSLLEEVNSIQNLTNKLNERRFMIFLQLARMNPAGSFINDNISKKNLIETVTNGDLNLVESLNQFFRNPQSCRLSNQKKRKPTEKNTNRSRRQEKQSKSVNQQLSSL